MPRHSSHLGIDLRAFILSSTPAGHDTKLTSANAWWSLEILHYLHMLIDLLTSLLWLEPHIQLEVG